MHLEEARLAERGAGANAEITEQELRARFYGLLARLIASSPDADDLRQLSLLSGDPSPLGQAISGIASAAVQHSPKDVADEHFELFVGVGRGELLPYASFYLTGFLNERPLAELRDDLAVMGIERAAGRHDPEDHIATLCDIMAGLARGQFDASVLGCGAAGEAGFFARHLEPWAGQFFDDLAKAPSARFYRSVAELGQVFFDIERRAFEMDRPSVMAASMRSRN